MTTEIARSPKQILETQSLFSPPTTAKPSPVTCVNEQKRRDWLKKWLRLKAHHPKLVEAENSIYRFCGEFAKHPATGRTLILYGDNGCGKSHIAKAVSRWAKSVKMLLPLVSDHDQNGQVSTAVCLFVNWAAIVDGFKPPRCDYQIVEDLQICTLLVLDDIGAEYDPSKLGAAKLYSALNRREHRWNIITTNYTPEEWGQQFDNKVSSRLFRNAEHIDLTGVPDYSAL